MRRCRSAPGYNSPEGYHNSVVLHEDAHEECITAAKAYSAARNHANKEDDIPAQQCLTYDSAQHRQPVERILVKKHWHWQQQQPAVVGTAAAAVPNMAWP